MSAQSIFFLIFFVFYIGVDSSEFENCAYCAGKSNCINQCECTLTSNTCSRLCTSRTDSNCAVSSLRQVPQPGGDDPYTECFCWSCDEDSCVSNGENSNCEHGRAGSDFYCCDKGCDEGCGGTGCGGWGNDEDVCCKSTIVAAPYNGRSCDTHPPPCILTITNGNCEMGKRNGDYCCDPGCVEGCGGSGCGDWGNAGSGCGEECDVCCAGAINAAPYNGRSCSVYPPPCIIESSGAKQEPQSMLFENEYYDQYKGNYNDYIFLFGVLMGVSISICFIYVFAKWYQCQVRQKRNVEFMTYES